MPRSNRPIATGYPPAVPRSQNQIRRSLNQTGLTVIPYGRQSIDSSDIDAVVAVLKSDWLTTGPMVDRFEQALCESTQARHAVAVNSGTAALHAAIIAAGVQPNDEVILPAMTFCATANAVLYAGGIPVFADIDPDTLLVDPADVARRITRSTRAIIAVDYAGQPADHPHLRQLADAHGLVLIADACHSLGATCAGRPVGSLADLSCFSFHPVKPITAGEGGAVTVNFADPRRSDQADQTLRAIRNHGIDSDHRSRQRRGEYAYDMAMLGHNYRLSDLQSALALSQLRRLATFRQQRQRIADRYRAGLANLDWLRPLTIDDQRTHAWHLFVVQCHGADRDPLYQHLRQSGIGANVHYRPVYDHSYYRQRLGPVTDCPHTDRAYRKILSLPIFPQMTDAQVDQVLDVLRTFPSAESNQPPQVAIT